MNKLERDRVSSIVNCWIDYEDKREKRQSIINEGPTYEGKLAEFAGDMPGASDFKPDIMAIKADKLKKLEYSKAEQQAKELIYSIPLKARDHVTLYEQLKNVTNTETGQRYTLKEVADSKSQSIEYFKEVRALGRKLLIKSDKRLNPHIYQKAA